MSAPPLANTERTTPRTHIHTLSLAMALCPSCCRLQSSPTCCHLSIKKGNGLPSSTSRPLSHAVRAEIGHSVPARNFALHAVAAPPTELSQPFGKQGSQFADVLGNISILYSEVGEERRAAAECVQRMAEESGRSAEDYGRRALLFERSGEMAASSKLKGDRVLEELELLQSDILQRDEGRSSADYLRRAELFSKSAEIFGHKFFDEALS